MRESVAATLAFTFSGSEHRPQRSDHGIGDCDAGSQRVGGRKGRRMSLPPGTATPNA
jgi:hypothetical protein